MEEIVTQLTIEKAVNGFQVYLKDYRLQGTARPVPYVFESMGTMFKFLETQLDKKQI
jgi:hypothetical protein